MKKESDEKLFDVRLVQKHICDGLITLKDYEKHLESLGDSAQNAEELNLEDFIESDEVEHKETDHEEDLETSKQDEINSDPEITL